jgi:hypothetical protein
LSICRGPTVPGSDAVARQVLPSFVVVHVQPGQVRYGTKQTEPLLQSTAVGSPHAVPPS